MKQEDKEEVPLKLKKMREQRKKSQRELERLKSLAHDTRSPIDIAQEVSESDEWYE